MVSSMAIIQNPHERDSCVVWDPTVSCWDALRRTPARTLKKGRYVTSSPNTREPSPSTKSCTYWKRGRTSPWVLSFPHLLGQEHLEPLPHVGKEGIARSGRRSGSVLFLVYRGRDSSFGRLGARSWVLFVREISGYYWIKIKQVYQNDTKKFWSALT